MVSENGTKKKWCHEVYSIVVELWLSKNNEASFSQFFNCEKAS